MDCQRHQVVAELKAHELKWQAVFPAANILSKGHKTLITKSDNLSNAVALTRCELMLRQILKRKASSKTKDRIISATANYASETNGAIWTENVHPALVALTTPILS